VRSAEFASLVHLDEERNVFGATGAMPRSYVNALMPFELDEVRFVFPLSFRRACGWVVRSQARLKDPRRSARDRQRRRRDEFHVCPRSPRLLSLRGKVFGEDADDWAVMMLREEFASVTSCPLDDEERLFAPLESASSRSIVRPTGAGQTIRGRPY